MTPAKRAHLIANSKSGGGKGSVLVQEAQQICSEHGYELVHYKIDSPADFEKQSLLAVEAALKDGGIVIAAGGDGTIRGVAQAAHGKKVRFAAVPCGTFNFFARTHQIPEDPLEAFRLALTGGTRSVRLGTMNGHVFLINASLGLYAKSIQEREASTKRFGRHRLVVIVSSLISLLSDHFLLKVDLLIDGVVKTVKTPMIFIGNNALQLRDLDLKVAACLKQDALATVLMRPVTKWETVRIIFLGFLKKLESHEKVDTFCVDELTIYSRRSFHEIALDGEIITMTSPLRVRAMPDALNLVVPPRTSEIA